jgi:hypothetical protein
VTLPKPTGKIRKPIKPPKQKKKAPDSKKKRTGNKNKKGNRFQSLVKKAASTKVKAKNKTDIEIVEALFEEALKVWMFHYYAKRQVLIIAKFTASLHA